MVLERLRLDGQVAIITGAGRGVGRGIAFALAEAGATIVCSARSKNEIDETVQLIEASGGKAIALIADVMKRADLFKLAEDTFERFGRVDIVVNNAGGIDFKSFMESTEEDFRFHFDWNTTSSFLLAQAVTPYMIKAGSGSIINVSSGAGHIGIRGMLSYGVAKAATEQLTLGLAQELAPKIRVNCVALGAIMTPALQKLFDEDHAYRDRLKELTPLRTVGDPEDIGLAVLYLCSKGCYSTGEVLHIDGGLQETNLPYRLPDL
jgi:7-alpha-hydroxysteroid dehydrogenase